MKRGVMQSHVIQAQVPQSSNPLRKQDESIDISSKGSLWSVVDRIKAVSDRLEFLDHLVAIVFDKSPGQRLKGRARLHTILAENTWIFGEEFHFSVDDMSLTEVLRRHKAVLDEGIVIDAPFNADTQGRGILDLMLSRQISRYRTNQLTQLVVALKAPGAFIDVREISRIQSYAAAVTADERFHNSDVRWVFWLIGDDIGPVGKFMIGQNMSSGRVHKNAYATIYVKTWHQLIDDNRACLRFLQQRLGFQADVR
jgi:hypothetical protein